MKLTLHRETLLEALQLVIGIVDRKQTMPVLGNVLMETKDQCFSVVGTDLDIELIGQKFLENAQLTPSQFTLPGRKLMDICRALPEKAPIELFQDQEKIVLRSGRSRFVLSTYPVTEFPNFSQVHGNVHFSITQKDLLWLLQRTFFSMAQQDVRYYLNGLLLEVGEGIRAVATDGHRLAVSTVPNSEKNEQTVSVILPRKGVSELIRLLSETSQPVEVTLGEAHIRICAHTFTFSSKLIDGKFPKYERVIPTAHDKSFIIERDELRPALSRAAILCNEKFKGVRFEIGEGRLTLSANNREQEVAEEELSINYSGPPLDIAFNVTYLLDILNVVDPGPIKLDFLDAGSSVLLQEAASANSLFVVMPMRL